MKKCKAVSDGWHAFVSSMLSCIGWVACQRRLKKCSRYLVLNLTSAATICHGSDRVCWLDVMAMIDARAT